MDLVRWKIPLQRANEFAKAPAAFSDCGRQRTIKLAVKKELPVLGIEAHGIGRQQIDREIRRELRERLCCLSAGLFRVRLSCGRRARLYPCRAQSGSPFQCNRKVLASSRSGRLPTTGSSCSCSGHSPTPHDCTAATSAHDCTASATSAAAPGYGASLRRRIGRTGLRRSPCSRPQRLCAYFSPSGAGGVFPVEEKECRQVDVGEFLLTEM